VKHLSDLTSYKGMLPYASEIFGVYQPLLGWKSSRIQERIDVSTQERFARIMRSVLATVQPTVKAEFNPADRQLRVNELKPARMVKKPAFAAIVVDRVASALPPRRKYSPEIWDELLDKDSLVAILKDSVAEQAQSVYQQHAEPADRAPNAAAEAEDAASQLLAEESRTAGVLEILRKTGQYSTLERLFYGDEPQANVLLDLLRTAHDPFATIDPADDLDHVGLSPIGVAHLYREYFFELATFLGPPVGHVWLSPGSTVELVEVHTRRELVEQAYEKSIESARKSEKDTTAQDELSDAVKEDNSNNTKLGVNVSANQTWGWGSANESASFDFGTTEQRAREQTHRTMRQQSDKLSEEIKQSFKTTFRTVTETTDMSSKRYLLANSGTELINYELRRKMRQVAIQVQDIGSYLCWQTYVDDPGAQLGLGRLVHVGAPPDLTAVPPPEMVVPPKAFDQDVNITIPFITSDGASNDDDFEDGKETEVGWIFDETNHIAADITQGPVRCPQAGFRLASVTVDAQGHNAVLTVDPSTIAATPGTSDAFTFNVHLKHINFGGSDSMPAKATLHWEPTIDPKAIEDKNKERLERFTAQQQANFQKAFMDEARERITLASNLQPRPAEDLREEERIVVYRQLIQKMLAPAEKIPQPDAQTQHVVAELIDSIFDVDKLLYFVAPEWWRPRLHRSAQALGGMTPIPDPVTGEPIKASTVIPKEDYAAWGEGDSRPGNYYITESSKPARLGSSLGWLLQLDGDDYRNAFLNAPWVKAVIPIRPGKEAAAFNWLRQVEGTNGIGPDDIYQGPEPEWAGEKTVYEVLGILAERVAKKYDESLKTKEYKDPLDDSSTVHATPIDRVYEHGFDPLDKGFQAHAGEDFEIFDQWIEVLPTDQVAAAEVKYDPKTGLQV
jgi:hypothetical protein